MRPHQRIPVRVITLVAALAAVAGCRMGKPDFTQASPSDPAIVSQTQEVPVAAPRSYRCERASEPPALEGTFDDGAWSKGAWTEDFVVVRRRGPAGSVRTRAKLLWDDSYLYCAVELLEPQVAQQPGVPPVRHDVELMVADDPQVGGYQIELVGMGTIVDAWFDADDVSHAGYQKWDAKGLRTSVQKSADGATMRWTASFALPWSTLAPAGRGPRLDAGAGDAPRAGAVWHVDMGRTTWRPLAEAGNAAPEPTAMERAAWQPPADPGEPRGWGVVEFAP